MNMDRRSVMAGMAAWACAGMLWRPQRATAQAATALRVQDLRGLSLIQGAGGNLCALPGGDGLLLVDSGAAESAGAVTRLLGQRFGAGVADVLINTHWRVDHTGGNDQLAGARTRILAHENTRLWMSTGFFVEWEQVRYAPRAVAAQPNETFYASDPQPIALAINAEHVRYEHLPQANTDGDIVVRFDNRNIIVAGGVVTVGAYPVMDYITGGWIGGLTEATRELIAMADTDTLIVPAVGDPVSVAHLQAQLAMLEAVRERIEERALVGIGIDEMIAEGITRDFDARFGANAARFIANTYHGLWWGNRMRGVVA